MTCIVGIKTKDKIIIAGDNMGSDGYTSGQFQPKVFKKESFIFGVCGSYRVMRLLQYKFSPPKRFIGQSVEEYLHNDFTDSVLQLLKNNNATISKDGMFKMDCSFVFAHENKLMQMYDDFTILENARGYEVCGSGRHHAIASLYSTEGLKVKPETRLKKAIECANEFVISVDNTINMVELSIDNQKNN